MAIKVANVKEAFCAYIDGVEVYSIFKLADSYAWASAKDKEFLIKYPDYDETDKKETEAPAKAEPKKEDPEPVVSDGVKGKILDKTRRGWNVKDIAEYCKCSTQTVRNWQKRFKEEGMLDMTL